MRTIQAAKSKQTDTKPEPGVCSDNNISLCIRIHRLPAEAGTSITGLWLSRAKTHTNKRVSERANQLTKEKQASTPTKQRKPATSWHTKRAKKARPHIRASCIVYLGFLVLPQGLETQRLQRLLTETEAKHAYVHIQPGQKKKK